MIHARHVAGLGATFLLLGTAACQTEQSPAETELGICRQDAAQVLAGRDRITDDEAKRSTGATIVRQIKPGDPVTMDLRRERVTIETDAATGKIVRAFCG